MLTLDTIGSFTWNYNKMFFIETKEGNFEWSDPEYLSGTNEIHPFKGTYNDWRIKENIPFGRDKGKHSIRDYCGENVKIFNE